MKIVLVNPFATFNDALRRYPLEPLGLLSLATFANREIKARNHDIQITILDAQMEGPEISVKRVLLFLIPANVNRALIL